LAGQHGDLSLGAFVQSPEKQFPYSEERVGNEIQYREIKVTLHPVVGGNVRTISISREEFLRGNQD
jgi:hypothetical protein